jgi:hypothetical protein
MSSGMDNAGSFGPLGLEDLIDRHRRMTEEEVAVYLTPIVLRIVARHGKKEALRLLREAVVAAGFDPNEFRCIDWNEPAS